jgi:hypothetical protein
MNEQQSQTASLSLVVVSFNELGLLERCLASIVGDADDTEVIVVRAAGMEKPDRLRHSYARFIWLEAPERCTVPQMRRLGIETSSGDIVALTEDDCLMQPSWSRLLRRAHEQNFQAIGGAVVPAEFDSPLDWGVFFCEYARFLPPFEGVVTALPGNNVSYKRATLHALQAKGLFETGFYEAFVNLTLMQSGEQLHADRELSVTNINHRRLPNATSVPFHHGRGFAGMRFAQHSSWLRAPYLAITVVLPALQTLRVCHQVLSRKQYRTQLLGALPAILLFWISWSIGEFMGYLLGPGASLEQWR